MSIEIPDAAVEAAQQVYRSHLSNAGVKAKLEAALPHLRAAILADLREKCEGAVRDYADEEGNSVDARAWHCHSAAEGVRLAISYIVDEERMGK